ncbi:MAG: acryloyl-CoA reductase [Betaproteobacteria bacterium]|nr:acryloyl-CoA reductase [Betaproteobacteria bacterium]
MSDKFQALRVFDEGGKSVARVVETSLSELDAGEVVIKTACSSVNYKDALAVTGAGKVIRRFPCTAGIDSAGTVVESSDARFKSGDAVIATSYDLGVAHDGGFAQYVRAKADWVVPLPAGLSLYESMALGTAGYTAGLAIELAEKNDLTPARGKILVNGATGGVASLCIDMLSRLGYAVTALTGKAAEAAYLQSLGAAEVQDRNTVELGTRALEKPLWAGAFDSVGGEQLGWLTRTMQQNGVIASFGNAGGIELKTTVLPFILRGVRLLGVDSGYTPMPLRRKVWERLATDLRPQHLETIAHRIALADVPAYCGEMLAGRIRGRAVVAFE